jgi:hypothetical protein
VGDSDDRIRAFLDLGDSSPATKRLNDEIETLLGKLKRLTEDFGTGKMGPQEFATAQTKLRAEIRETSDTLDGLHSPERISGMDKMTKTLFGLERGLSSVASGSGLGRAGGLLEAGLSMFGGAAGMGLGYGIAMLANTVENVLPKLERAWGSFMGQMDPEKMAEVKKGLADLAAAYRIAVEDMERRRKPGTEDLGAAQQAGLARLLNIGSMKQVESALLSSALHHDISDMKRTEIDELSEAQAEIKRLEQQTKIKAALPSVLKAAMDAAVAKLQDIELRVASRTRDKLLKEASEPDTPAGKAALRTLQNLAHKRPELYPQGFAHRIQEILDGILPDRPPAQEVLDRERQERIEAAERQIPREGRPSRIKALEDFIARGGEEFVGPPAPSRKEMLNRRRRMAREAAVRRGRGELPPGVPGPPAPRFGQPPRPGEPGDHAQRIFQWIHRNEQQHQRDEERQRKDLEHIRQKNPGYTNSANEIARAQARAYETPYQKQRRVVEEDQQQMAVLRAKFFETLELQRQGMISQQKAQQLIHSIEMRLRPLTAIVRQLNSNATKMLADQQRTNQNEGGNP